MRAHGMTFKAICEKLDVLEGSLRLWMDQSPERSLVPVRIVEPTRPGSEIVVVSPSGLRVEGLTVEQAAELLGALR